MFSTRITKRMINPLKRREGEAAVEAIAARRGEVARVMAAGGEVGRGVANQTTKAKEAHKEETMTMPAATEVEMVMAERDGRGMETMTRKERKKEEKGEEETSRY